jgi:hypothetical protein
MSRRHHGRPHHGRHRNEGPRPDATATRPIAPAPLDAAPVQPIAPVAPTPAAPSAAVSPSTAPIQPSPTSTPAPVQPPHTNGAAAASPSAPTHTNGHDRSNGNERSNGCTAPQLRRFIKSRPYVPMHELRRRFAIDGTDDDVTQVDLEGGHVYVGLPAREGSLLGELLRGGEIGYELSFDPLAPIVVGVYPMRPVPRT